MFKRFLENLIWKFAYWGKEPELYWHIHHGILIEKLTEPIQNRIKWITEEKPKDEIELRLSLIKKVKAERKDWPITQKGWERLHQKECPDCSWNGENIFPENKGRKRDK